MDVSSEWHPYFPVQMVLQAFQDAMTAEHAECSAGSTASGNLSLPPQQQRRRSTSLGSNSGCGPQQQQDMMQALYRLNKKMDDQHLRAMEKIAEVAKKVDALNANLLRLAELTAVRTQNARAGPHAALEWPETLQGGQPADACATVSELASATECQMDSLLQQYQLSKEGQLGMKRKRLLSHIGVRVTTELDECKRLVSMYQPASMEIVERRKM